MADPAQDQGQQVVQSFASDLEERIKEKNHIEDVNARKTNRLIRTVFSVRASVINSPTGRPEVQDRACSSAATACRWRPPAAGGGPDLREACLLARGLSLNVAQNVVADCYDWCRALGCVCRNPLPRYGFRMS
jgi:hypothetical protein